MKPLRMLTGTVLALTLGFACGETTGGSSSAQWAVCSVSSDCALAAKTCCGVCGKPTVDDVDAINENHADEHHRAVCPTPVACSACPTQKNPDLLATCASGTCRAFDVRRDAASACTRDEDCRLRVTSCCECGGSLAPSDLIAVNRAQEGLYAALVCDPNAACPACAPIYPTEFEARCASDGHCEVRPAESRCSLTFDPGPCKAAIRVFAFVDGACVERTYGGCEGNDNRFSSVEECMAACQGQPDPNGCPTGRIRRNVCVSCGPAGGCGTRADVCAKTCTANADCDAPLWYCTNGACEVGGCI